MNETSFLTDKIKTLIPLNEQEAADKESFLFFLNTFKENIWTRENPIGHLTASCWIINKEKTKALMAFHLIFKSFAWLGGHADGKKDLLKVALKEAEEESGIKTFRPLSRHIADISVLEVPSHVKKGKNIPAHLHFNVTYMLEADETSRLRIKEDENRALRWIPFDNIDEFVSEEHMKPVYHRLILKSKS